MDTTGFAPVASHSHGQTLAYGFLLPPY